MIYIVFFLKNTLAWSSTNNDQIVVHTSSNPLLWRWIIKGDFVINFSFVTILQKVWTYRLETLLEFGGCLKKIDRIWCRHMLDSSLIRRAMNKHLGSFALHQKQNKSTGTILRSNRQKSNVCFKLICWYFSWHRNQPEIKDTVVTEDLLT